jgi:cystathionine gamma-lyase
MLASRDEVVEVRYPGLPEDPGHEIARRQMNGLYGSVVGFDLGSAEHAQAFLSACELVFEATSFGGVHSMAERRARWAGDAISVGFIRFSVGCETARDIVDDVTQALDHAR